MKAKCETCGRYYQLKLHKGEKLANFACDCGRKGLARATNEEIRNLNPENYEQARHDFGYVAAPKPKL